MDVYATGRATLKTRILFSLQMFPSPSEMWEECLSACGIWNADLAASKMFSKSFYDDVPCYP